MNVPAHLHLLFDHDADLVRNYESTMLLA